MTLINISVTQVISLIQCVLSPAGLRYDHCISWETLHLLTCNKVKILRNPCFCPQVLWFWTIPLCSQTNGDIKSRHTIYLRRLINLTAKKCLVRIYVRVLVPNQWSWELREHNNVWDTQVHDRTKLSRSVLHNKWNNYN
jgi:hypothetical protein